MLAACGSIERTHAFVHQYPLPFFLRKERFDILRFLIAGKRTRRRSVLSVFVRTESGCSVSFLRNPSAGEERRPLSRSTYRRRGIISLALYSQHAYLLEVRVTATPAAPRRSAIELMMLGPRRFNNKPHYLQSALGSITTGSVSDSPGPAPFPSSPLLLFSPSPPQRLLRRRRLALPHRKCARPPILNLCNQSAPTPSPPCLPLHPVLETTKSSTVVDRRRFE